MGRDVQEGGTRCIPKAGSCSCMAETNKHYKAIILQLKIIFLNNIKNELTLSHPTIFQIKEHLRIGQTGVSLAVGA